MSSANYSNLNVAVVCSSNMNRSMEAHSVLAKKGFRVDSFGTGNAVKIPGPSRKQPNIYPFGTTYEHILSDLVSKDKRLYTENGMLNMLERNRRIKERPQRFIEALEDSSSSSANGGAFGRYDVVLTCEEKCHDLVVENFESRGHRDNQPVHVVNMDIVDNAEDATIGAFLLCELAVALASSEDLDDEIVDIIQDYEDKCKRDILHTVSFY